MSLSKARIGFAGTGAFAVPSLIELSKISKIEIVISQCPRPSGKSKVVVKSPIEFAAETLALPVVTPQKIEEINSQISALNLDVIVLSDYGQIIPSSTLKIPRLGFLNIHPSLLPRHRGPAPVVAGILSNDKKTGISIIKMDDKMDHGPIVAQELFPLTGQEMVSTLETELSIQAGRMISKVLPQYLSGSIQVKEQDHNVATYHKLVKRADGQIDWSESAKSIYTKYRAYYPWPGVWFKTLIHNKLKLIKFHSLELWDIDAKDHQPAIFFTKNNFLGITTTSGSLKINKLQVEGREILDSEQFCRGYEDIIVKL